MINIMGNKLNNGLFRNKGHFIEHVVETFNKGNLK